MSNELKKQLIDARDKYIDLIKSELMGPGSELNAPDCEHELISTNPLSRYTVGILYPQIDVPGDDNFGAFAAEELKEIHSDTEEHERFEPDLGKTTGDNHTSNKRDTQKAAYENNDAPDNDADFENDSLDDEVSLAAQYRPSSMGLTFLVRGTADKVCCNVKMSTYRRAKACDCVVPCGAVKDRDQEQTYVVPCDFAEYITFDSKEGLYRLLNNVDREGIKKIRDFLKDPEKKKEYPKPFTKAAYRLCEYFSNGYVRIPVSFDNIVISFGESDIAKSEIPDVKGAQLSAMRTKISDDAYSLTIMLVNLNKTSYAVAEQCIFQSRIEVLSDNNDFIFIDNHTYQDPDSMDDEDKSLELLYRKKKNYSTGLGVASDWDVDDSGCGKVWTDFFPVREVPSMSFSLPENSTIDNSELSMKYLSDLNKIDKQTKLSSLDKFVDLYDEWIENLEKETDKIDPCYKSAASKNISSCKKASKRMRAGIETLRINEKAYNAFSLANRAMFMQRIHLRKQSDLFKSNADRYNDDQEVEEWLNNVNYTTESDSDCIWRPFQLAFILMDINSLVHDDSPDRSIVDLIWFPTGGGKTEAYLGVTAFCIFYRKLAYLEKSSGTSVIMRYTLRLLASQQFTRASTLICAIESIRKNCVSSKDRRYPVYALGKDQITIGLWIGGAHTPNSNKEAKKCWDDLCNATDRLQINDNKFQVLKCPWCGTKLVKDRADKGIWGYRMDGNHFVMSCPQAACEFNEVLPIQVVDEELYRTPPTLLFSTVDKFAMMTWEGKCCSFFNLNKSSKKGSKDNRSPELIIQDELHLISGSLGTMVGLYETAVDGLSGVKGVAPKVIASTATIRRAREQCSVLYNREMEQFPAPGIDASDSFFARESVIDHSSEIFGRKYVGIMPSGRTKASTEVRIIAALLQRVNAMELPDNVKDKLWTLTVYFNSLKDLGKTGTLVVDDVVDFMKRIRNRLFIKPRFVRHCDELTSRVTTNDLNETLENLEKIEYSEMNKESSRKLSDVLLATNMISVGLDVARLNVMHMVGQPKLASEYIQASSRVGRKYPGVAFIQYDSSKSRDRSYYERFRGFHESFYRFVEPTGATPFSKPARDRALHAVIVALLRHKMGLTDDKDAEKFDEQEFYDAINWVKKFITDRVAGINKRTQIGGRIDVEEVKNEIEEFFEFWIKKNSDIELRFGRSLMRDQTQGNRLLKSYESTARDNAWRTLTSMRNVDIQVAGEIIIRED
ncbi:helicase-related protein [Ruminobacter amylophilus]|uniref:helicase-related protein n=1 Tax=Ruminobacter amylophilus TaxID=867 RepID=UPI00386497E0